MRTRIDAEVEVIYFLRMNPVHGRTEEGTDFGPFNTIEELKSFYDTEKVDMYQDTTVDRWSDRSLNGLNPMKPCTKHFRKGGLLESMNPLAPDDFLTPNRHGQGVHMCINQIYQVFSLG